jgi:DNA-binding response OmpR family regulator
MRILVVEDENRMADLIQQGLEEEAHAVDVIGNGAAVFDWIKSVNYDVLLMDIMLPGKDGITVCKELRAAGYTMPILMLTARDTLPDKVKGLDSGADDYLVKPFAIQELTARVRALGRREGPIKTAELTVNDLILDTATKRAKRGDKIIQLKAKEYALLETLMRHPNQVLSREQIIERVWSMEFDAESKLVEVYIHWLRKKIDTGHADKLIHTVHGLGYRIGNDE